MRPAGAGGGGTSVTVVIVNWNRHECVLSLMDSLWTVDQSELRVIVVDNASSDGSAAAIRDHALPVILLENSENLGGSGGFNTGIRYALEHFDQQFIWLLDNDAEVTPSTLRCMVQVMIADRCIGVVGSCIMSPEDHALIVEAGGFVDRGSATWRPNRRYQRHEEYAGRNLVEEVDYVPACSALVSRELLERIGLLDERYFLHWDDIDFCARARQAGFRVVAALDSLVFHGAEKGHSRMTLYYDFRNALLYFSKHARGAKLISPALALLTRNLASSVYSRVTGRKQVAAYLYQGLRDFLDGRFARVSIPPGFLVLEPGGAQVLLSSFLSGKKKVVVFAAGSYEEVVAAVSQLQAAAPDLAVTIAVAADRAQAYSFPELGPPITFDLFRDGLAGKLRTSADLLKARFEAGISAGNAFTVPYAFLLRENLVFDAENASFRVSDVSVSSLWKLPFALVLGHLVSVFFLVPVLLAARRFAGAKSGNNGMRNG